MHATVGSPSTGGHLYDGFQTHQVATANSVFLGPISALARQKRTWSPDLLAGVVWRGLTHPRTHRRVLQLLETPVLRETARLHPRFAFKYLTHDYLVRGVSTEQRGAAFLHHYNRLRTSLNNDLLRAVLLADATLNEMQAGDHCFAMTLCLPREWDKEGELSLNLQVDGEIIFVLAFSIVPGSLLKLTAGEVLLISRLQGIKGAYSLIHRASKALSDVAPAALLLAALQGVAEAFGISTIVAVSARRQSSYTEEYASVFHRAYDEFFSGLGIAETRDGLFVSEIPVKEKPLAEVKKGHKIRTREKRVLKQWVQASTATFFRERMAGTIATAEPVGSEVLEESNLRR